MSVTNYFDLSSCSQRSREALQNFGQSIQTGPQKIGQGIHWAVSRIGSPFCKKKEETAPLNNAEVEVLTPVPEQNVKNRGALLWKAAAAAAGLTALVVLARNYGFPSLPVNGQMCPINEQSPSKLNEFECSLAFAKRVAIRSESEMCKPEAAICELNPFYTYPTCPAKSPALKETNARESEFCLTPEIISSELMIYPTDSSAEICPNVERSPKQENHGAISLHRAFKEGNLDRIKSLCNNGADINALDQDHYTPLLWATRQNQADVANWLIDQGADIHAKTKNGTKDRK